MSKYAELIERLEKLTGPDREIDAEIEAALCCPCYSESLPSLPDGWAWDFEAENDYVTVYMVLGNKTSKKLKRYSPPKYSESIDAALTIVPEGFKWKCGYGRHVPHTAELRDYRDKPILGTFIGECDSNRAIALCIAALRAREESAHD